MVGGGGRLFYSLIIAVINIILDLLETNFHFQFSIFNFQNECFSDPYHTKINWK